MVIGYSWAFTEGSDYLGGMSRFLLIGMNTDVVSPLASTIPESVYMSFQMTFAIITPALIRRFRRPHEVLGDDVVHGALVAPGLLADRSLGLGRRLARRPRRSRLRRRHRPCISTPVLPV